MDFHEFHIITIPIGVLLLLILLLVICQCILPCCGRPKKGRRYSNEEAYFQSINRLLERQKLVEKQKEEREQAIEQLNESLYSIPSPRNTPYRSQSRSPPQPRRSSTRASSKSPPRRPSSRSSSLNKPETVERLSKLKEELEQYKVDHSIKIRLEEPNLEERRRTWGGLQDDYLVNDESFSPVEMPNVATVAVQTTSTLERRPKVSVETTV